MKETTDPELVQLDPARGGPADWLTLPDGLEKYNRVVVLESLSKEVIEGLRTKGSGGY